MIYYNNTTGVFTVFNMRIVLDEAKSLVTE